MEEREFIKIAKKVTGPREHKITNSFGVYDAYKYYRKNKPKDKKYILSESQYFTIIRRINEYLKDTLYNGEDIVFPERMGKLEVRKREASFKKEGNKVKTNLPIDWDSTLKLWYEDPDSFKNKKLVRLVESEIFRIKYNKINANYNNKSFYQFSPNRELKIGLKSRIKNSNFDAFKY